MSKGIIKRYDFRKGFGFITEDNSGDDFFFHKSEWQGEGPIRQGLKVNFSTKDSDKGPQAEAVTPLNGEAKSTPKAAPSKPARLEDRVAALESSVTTWKVITVIALLGVVALGVERFVL